MNKRVVVNGSFGTMTAAWPWIGAFLLLAACGGRTDLEPRGTDTSSHWLSACNNDSTCPTGLECLCGVCTRSCEEAPECRDLAANAVCLSAPGCGTPNVCASEDGLPGATTEPCEGEDCGTSQPIEPVATNPTDSTSGGPSTDPAPISAACSMLSELSTDVEGRGSAVRCAQFETEERARSARFVLERVSEDGGDEVPLSAAELAERRACVVSWADERGLEANIAGEDVAVIGTWQQLAPLLSSALFVGYSLECTDECEYCRELNEQDCGSDDFCGPYTGALVNIGQVCLEPGGMFECLPGNQDCSPLFQFAEDEAGQCWLFSSICQTSKPLELDTAYCSESLYQSERYLEGVRCEDDALCYGPFEEQSGPAFADGSVGCDCEYENREVCDEFLYVCSDGRWSAGQDGICFVQYGRCDRTFDSLETCLATGYDCHLGPAPETDPVCGIQGNSTAHPLFTPSECELMGGTVTSYSTDVWVRLPDDQNCEVPDNRITTASCVTVGGYASCRTGATTVFCSDDETPITRIDDCAEGEGYCCVPDSAL